MKDILLDNTYDLQITNSDFVLGDATHQNQGLILLASPGEFRQFPFVGVGLRQYLNDDRASEIATVLTQQLRLDGMVVREVEMDRSGGLKINAYYE